MSSKQKPSAALAPMRRFPGFSDAWEYEPLSHVLREHKIKNAAGRDVFSVSMESGIVNQIAHLGRSFAANDTSHYNVGHRFDVVYTKSPLKAFPFGIVKQCKFDGEVALSPLYGVFTPKNPHVGLMIEAYFEAPERAQAFLSPLCQKGAKNTIQISNRTFLSGRMALPKQEGEQEKIGGCLESVDVLIAEQRRKVAALRVHKNALMQQLFPHAGETEPRRRFPEFAGAPAWEPTTIGELGRFYYGKSAPKWSLSPDAPTPCVRYGELYTRFGSIITETFSRTNIDPENLRFSKGGEILIPRVGERPDDFGQCCAYLPLAGIAIGEMISVYETDQNPLFFTYYFRNLYKHFSRVVEGQNVKNLYFKELEPIPVLLPSLGEQEAIAGCLLSIDDLITAQTRKLEALMMSKKGLVQQLFPRSVEAEA